jgi:hypothetical protein
MPIQIVIWDKQNDVAVNSEDSRLYVGVDGFVYELTAACMGGDTWLSNEDVSDRYEVRLRE